MRAGKRCQGSGHENNQNKTCICSAWSSADSLWYLADLPSRRIYLCWLVPVRILDSAGQAAKRRGIINGQYIHKIIRGDLETLER